MIPMSNEAVLLQRSRYRLACALFPFSNPFLPLSFIRLFLFFKEPKMNTGSSFHYLISLLLVHLFINSFLTPRNLYTFFGLFQL